MDYKESLAFIEKTKKQGIVPGLSNIRNLMAELGNVQDELPIVHIAGTNGKGSVGTFLQYVLQESGYHVGRFSSPAVFAYEEMFMLDGRNVTEQELAAAFTQVREACDRLVEKGLPHPTEFEAETAAAFLMFYEKKCDVVLLEVGMGGLEDATNLIQKPLVSVLTSISFDHWKFLGDTVEAIARQKAGIIKKGCPAVIFVGDSPEYGKIYNQIITYCEAVGGIPNPVYADLVWNISMNADGIRFTYDRWQDLEIQMSGSWQIDNVVCALDTLKILQEAYPDITDETIRAGLKKAVWKGRFSKLGEHPDFYLDGAHNADAAMKLRETLDLCFPDEKLICIVGVLADKDVQGILEYMLPKTDFVYTVTPDNHRAMDAKQLAAMILEMGYEAQACASMDEAIRLSIQKCKDDQKILAFGSLSYQKDLSQAYIHYIEGTHQPDPKIGKSTEGVAERKQDKAACSYVDQILQHPLFTETQKEIVICEKERIYCCHQLSHLLDVARIAWIMYMEDHMRQVSSQASDDWKQRKEDLYVCALLHDIGRAQQYRHGIHHCEAGEKLAQQILKDIDYPMERRGQICETIFEHGHKKEKGESEENWILPYIAKADLKSRNCFACDAIDTCKWSLDKRNKGIEC